MMKLLFTEYNLPWIVGENMVETYMADVLPNVADCTSASAFVFKNGTLLQTELRDGERPRRGYDIPGGHIGPGETLEETAIRETFEETGVRVKILKLSGYKKITITSPKTKDYQYPYPVSYMAYYLCEVLEETPFDGNEETHGRVWLKPEEFERSDWCRNNKVFLEEVRVLISKGENVFTK